MDLIEAMRERHSVRAYQNKPLTETDAKALTQLIAQCNKEGGLNIQLVKDEPRAFDGFMAHYGNFSGVTNYIAMIGKKGPDLDERCGYYGEKIVLEAQRLGLGTCWVALTYKKVPGAFTVNPGEKLVVVIAIGYGANHGVAHRSKHVDAVSNVSDSTPEWFRKGVEAALLAPTAVNQQKFTFVWQDGLVQAKPGKALCSKIDLGIAKYHFEIGSGKDRSIWR